MSDASLLVSFQLEVSIKAFDGNQTRLITALWQCHGHTDDEIYDELEVMFSYHWHLAVVKI
jgi:hypothetical protein